ncbi:YbaK/EbsC family protein [uncultured Pseudokineococcus sp.]|uniref:YbaK/EbsC family protein n=1 Tax=uncultured Pseudokineococcus sp. TaxID=1642928 RepID=UPI0026151F0A|nr:YbaK/EbsC family protein [uncultured Pseudokineococcus sp.]
MSPPEAVAAGAPGATPPEVAAGAPGATPPTPSTAAAAEGLPARDDVVALADADPRTTRVRQALADAGAEADVVVLDHVARSPEDLADELGVPVGALVRCHLLLVEEEDPSAPTATRYGGEPDEGPWPPPAGGAERRAAGDAEVPAVLVLAPQRRRVRATDVAGAASGLGVTAVRAAAPHEVLALTGCAPEDLPPTGLPTDVLRVDVVLVDTALGDHAVLWAPAGRPGTAMSTSYEELLRITLGHPVELS